MVDAFPVESFGQFRPTNPQPDGVTVPGDHDRQGRSPATAADNRDGVHWKVKPGRENNPSFLSEASLRAVHQTDDIGLVAPDGQNANKDRKAEHHPELRARFWNKQEDRKR